MSNQPKNNLLIRISTSITVLALMVSLNPYRVRAADAVGAPANLVVGHCIATGTNPCLISAALMASATATADSPTNEDNRADRIDAYFAKRDMPLAGYGHQFVAVADACGMDWRLLPAIGVRESSGGKHMLNNNPFGWGSAKIPFQDFGEAITVVADNLCGNNPATSSYYKGTTTYKKLWYYNGTVMPRYPDEVIAIMSKI